MFYYLYQCAGERKLIYTFTYTYVIQEFRKPLGLWDSGLSNSLALVLSQLYLKFYIFLACSAEFVCHHEC